MRSLIERHGASATVVPSMREVPLDENSDAKAFLTTLDEGRIDVVVFLTGVGATALADVAEKSGGRSQFIERLNRCCVVVRGPKPAKVLRDWQVRIDHHVPEPNTWRELLGVIDADIEVAGKTVAIQEYGLPNEDLYRELKSRGAEVIPVPVYRWAFPHDTGPLVAAIRSTINGEFDVLMFTSAQQVRNVIQAAELENLREAWCAAAGKCVVASIGPTASETLRDAGLTPDVEATPPKMGQLVKQTTASAERALQAKQGAP